MNVSLIKAAIFAGILVFFTNYALWQASPYREFQRFRSECAVKKCLDENAPRSGVYKIRADGTEATPFEFVGVISKNSAENLWFVRIVGLLEKIFVAGLIGGIMLVLKAGSIPGRIETILMISLIITIGGFGSTLLWCSFPLGLSIFTLVATFVSWTIGGLVVARVLKV
jgi:hypothetical protein